MNAAAVFRIAVRALLRNKLRSFLTVLGMIIGVAAVIAVVALGEGAKARVERTYAAMGSNVLIVTPGTTRAGGLRAGAGSLSSLTWDDLKAIQSELGTVQSAAPQVRANVQVLSDTQNWGTQAYGVTPAYFEIRSWPIAVGAPFALEDQELSAKVTVLGRTVAEKLFGSGPASIGKQIRIKNIPFRVIGVAGRKGQSSTGTDYDDVVFVPVSTFLSKIQGGLQKFLSGSIYVAATSPEATERAELQLEALLRERHRLRPGSENDFAIRNMTEIADARQESTRTLALLLTCIAGVSLLVGGIGIMNIMLVSVGERTREIGLRMAIGAKRKTILAQFLVEALVLSSAGGFLGVVLGFACVKQLGAQFGWPVLVRADVSLVAVLFSALVGVGFGLYPARKASLLDPIEALRHE
ncbi:MAG: ABC transporter permease [Polyangiaceae bacterium]